MFLSFFLFFFFFFFFKIFYYYYEGGHCELASVEMKWERASYTLRRQHGLLLYVLMKKEKIKYSLFQRPSNIGYRIIHSKKKKNIHMARMEIMNSENNVGLLPCVLSLLLLSQRHRQIRPECFRFVLHARTQKERRSWSERLEQDGLAEGLSKEGDGESM